MKRRKPSPFWDSETAVCEVEHVMGAVRQVADMGLDSMPGSERVVAALLELRAVVDTVINGQVMK